MEVALKHADNMVLIDIVGQKPVLYSCNYACPDCGFSFPELTPGLFSFNNPFGACPKCTGIGYLLRMDEDLIIPDKSKTKEITNTKALKYCNSNYVDGNCTCDDTNNDGLCDISSKDTWNINETDFNKITSALTGKGRKLTILSKIEADYCYNIFSNPYCGYNNSILDNGGTYIFTTDTTNLIV